MSHGERMVRIQLEVPLSMVARADALHRARAHDAPGRRREALYLEALDLGLRALETGEGGEDAIITAVTRVDRRGGSAR